jgi:plastocyanin
MIRNIAGLVIILLFLSGCNSSEKEKSANEDIATCPPKEEEGPPEEDIPMPSPRKTETGIHVIEIKQMKFEPQEITIHKGETVRWVNLDLVDHDVTEQTTKAWTSSPLHTGASWDRVVTETSDYYCNLHQVMKGKIIVE